MKVRMKGKRIYTQPFCKIIEVGLQSIMAGTNIRVNHTPVDELGGDINRNEGFDIWANENTFL